MKNISLKTKALNTLRNISKAPFLENYLVGKTQGKTSDNFYAKLIPNNYQYQSNTIRKCRRDGVEYELDISDYMQYCIYYGIKTEPREVLYNLVRNGTTVIDVGTNIGETLLNFSKLNTKGLNLGFEPVPFLYERARRNIQINKFKNIVLENLALSDSFGNLSFNLDNTNNSGGIFLTETAGENPGKTVKAVTLDHYVKQNNVKNISLIKIDVEGFEMNVLQGAKETLEEFHPALFVEINNSFLQRQNTSAKELFDYLQTLNYKIFYAENRMPLSQNYSFDNKHFDIIAEHAPDK